MTVRILPDTEAIAVAYLLGRSEITDVFGTQVGTSLDLTEDTALPALRVTRINARTVTRRHLRGSNVQLECFAVDELTAQDGCELAWAALLEDDANGPVGVHPGRGVVTGVDDALAPRRQPDPDTDTPRWLASVIIYAHPE